MDSLAAAIKDAGHDVHIVYVQSALLPRRYSVLPDSELREIPVSLVNSKYELKRIIKAVSPHIIHSHSSSTWEWISSISEEYKIPYVLTGNGIGLDTKPYKNEIKEAAAVLVPGHTLGNPVDLAYGESPYSEKPYDTLYIGDDSPYGDDLPSDIPPDWWPPPPPDEPPDNRCSIEIKISRKLLCPGKTGAAKAAYGPNGDVYWYLPGGFEILSENNNQVSFLIPEDALGCYNIYAELVTE